MVEKTLSPIEDGEAAIELLTNGIAEAEKPGYNVIPVRVSVDEARKMIAAYERLIDSLRKP